MSDISIHKLGDKEYGLVKVPSNSDRFYIKEGLLRWTDIYHDKAKQVEGNGTIMLPVIEGEWELVGKGSELSFVDWAGIIESEHDGSGTLTRWYKNYIAPDNMFYGHPKESGLSWLKSLSYDPETIVIIRKIK